MHSVFLIADKLEKGFVEDIIRASVKHGVVLKPLKDGSFISVRKEEV